MTIRFSDIVWEQPTPDLPEELIREGVTDIDAEGLRIVAEYGRYLAAGYELIAA